MSTPEHQCNSDGGRSIGAGHVCLCNNKQGHPVTEDRPHGCECGAWWVCDDCIHADLLEGCAGCGAFPRGRWRTPAESDALSDAMKWRTRLDEAEARVNSLHTQLDEQIAFNRQRSDALNRTAANNDQLRATVARVEALHRKTYDSPSDEAYQRNAVCDNCEVSWPCGTVAALADQETT